ncbi:MAG: hypothetical protein KA105_02575 [Caulobacter sp.]|nr:hypothetical protein [Caulobacter sp.]
MVTPFELGRVMWEARKREAWGKSADAIMARTPWPPHASHPETAEEHLLAMAEAKAVLKLYEVRPVLTPDPELEAAAEGGAKLRERIADLEAHALKAERLRYELVRALAAADKALAQVTAFEDDARYIMGHTNFNIVVDRHKQVRAGLSKAQEPS